MTGAAGTAPRLTSPHAGEMAALVAAMDWSRTALGPRDSWSASLNMAVEIVLASGFPMALRWGPDFVLIYNDGYLPILGDKHPWALGRPAREAWSEVWPHIEPFHQQILTGASPAVFARDLPLRIQRRGDAWEDAVFTLSYSPTPDPTAPGGIGGVFVTAIETTAQFEAIRELKESEAQLERALSAGNGIGAWDFDVQADRVTADVRFAKLHGVDPAKAKAGAPLATFFASIHPDDREGALAQVDEELRTGKGFMAEYRLVQADGSVRWVVAQGRCEMDADGSPRRFPGVCFDITERKHTEQRLRDLNANLERTIIERTQARGMTWQVSPDLMGALNAEGYFETSNPAWETVLGWTEAEVANQSIWEMLHPDDLERTREGFRLTQVGQPAIRFPNRYRAKDGSYRWLSWVGVPEDGMVYCTGRDITADKAAEAERDRLWTLARDMLARADYSGMMSAVNPAWTEILGFSEEELLSRPYSDFMHPDDVEVTFAALQHMGKTEQATRFENRILASNGEFRPIGWTVAPEPDGVNFIAVGRDLTEDKARERELLAAQEALRQSQKMEAVGQLTGGIAHDFNNLLAGISGSLEMLQTRIGQNRFGDLHRYIEAAMGSTRRAASLTQRLLAFSRRQVLDPKPVDANRLIGGVDDLIRRTLGPSITLEVVGAGGLWLTKVDPSQLENALLNLSINARDAMPDGGRPTIETANRWLDARAARDLELPPGQYVAISVSDTGIGMTPDVIERAFDPFFTTKPLGQGTGLGLSMIHGFVRQSGGQTRAYSEVGQGTTMTLYLPRFGGDLEPEIAESPLSSETGRGETVLVIDDEPVVRMLMIEVLRESGYTCLEADDGPSGLRVLQSEIRIDLLVTDVGLPGGMNGRQVADAARATRPDLKVLFVTGYAENAAVGNGHLETGMEVITKPFAMAELGAKVREMVER